MTIPTQDDFLNSAAEWHGSYLGIQYEVAWHGRSTYQPGGIWNWYVFVSSEQFYPEEWAKLRLNKKDYKFGESWHRGWSYDEFPDIDAHGGMTFGKLTTYLGRDGKEHEMVKIGCDYNHSFDMENDYPYSLESVTADVKRSIELLTEQFPHRRVECAYSGKYGDASEFYTAVNGKDVHKSCLAKLTEQGGWEKWLPKELSVTL